METTKVYDLKELEEKGLVKRTGFSDSTSAMNLYLEQLRIKYRSDIPSHPDIYYEWVGEEQQANIVIEVYGDQETRFFAGMLITAHVKNEGNRIGCIIRNDGSPNKIKDLLLSDD